MLALISLVVVLVISLLVVRVATEALTLTGISRPLARFQARSAFTGTGFTTSEAEQVVQHPVRRRIVMLLMLLGNAGIVTAMSSLIVSMTDLDSNAGFTGTLWFRVLVLGITLVVLWIVASSRFTSRIIDRTITWALGRWTDLDVRDYDGLLHLSDDYLIAEMAIRETDWVAGKALTQLRLSEEGILILGIHRADGTYLGAPRGGTILRAGDSVLLYGRDESLASLDSRESGIRGNWEHFRAVDRQQKAEREQNEKIESVPTDLGD